MTEIDEGPGRKREPTSKVRLSFSFVAGVAVVMVDHFTRAEKHWCIYFVEDVEKNQIKIGRTRYLAWRLRQLAAERGHDLELRRWLLTKTMQSENVLHLRFGEFLQHGEWFEFSVPIREYIAGTVDGEYIDRGFPWVRKLYPVRLGDEVRLVEANGSSSALRRR